MLKKIREATKDDKGFTLIELMVVVLIIAILIAIAIPTFLGLRRRAQDRSAQSNLRNGLTAAKAYFTDADTYTGFVADAPAPNTNDGEGIEPSLTWVDGAPGAATIGTVGITQVTPTQLTLEVRSASTARFCIADDTAAGTVRGVGAAATWAACNLLVDW